MRRNVRHMLIRNVLSSLLMIVFMCWSVATFADSRDLYEFDTPAQQTQFQEILTRLRCLVCQNQNLADSNAPLARDLRDEIYKKFKAGEDREMIMSYLTDRYGDFVLYRPPLQKNTYILWFGPLLFLFIGFVVLFFIVCRRDKKIS